MPSLANEVLERVTESELGVGDRIFGQIPFDGGSSGVVTQTVGSLIDLV